MTKEIQEETWQWQERDITIIDTPPLNAKDEFIMISKHARTNYSNIQYGFVIAIGRLFHNEPVLLKMISKNLNKKIEDLVLIFTRYDDLDSDESFRGWLLGCPKLKKFIDNTNIKCFHFANKNGTIPVVVQVNDLMSTITGISNKVELSQSQEHVNRSIKMDTWVNEITHNESQAHSTKLKPTKKVTSKPDILVSCEVLEDYFGKCGVLFYNEMLKNGK